MEHWAKEFANPNTKKQAQKHKHNKMPPKTLQLSQNQNEVMVGSQITSGFEKDTNGRKAAQ